ncbi:MAG: hypothetical protein M3340_17995 [Actinomycetota bacterium]|nr:hypothetical protein [Actinomycetota bacterium]
MQSDLTVVTFEDRPELAELAPSIGAQVWPEYNRHGDVVMPLWPRLAEDHARFQLALLDAAGEVVALGWTLPCRWDGTPDGLPAGIDGLFEAAFGDNPQPPSALSAVAAEVPPERRRAGLSEVILTEMRALAARHGLTSLIASLRPTWKDRYPLAPIERYARWTREDGQPFDPWIRLHVRLGARILRPEPRSLAISGTVAEWEGWTGMSFPESGEYVFPAGLAPVAIDREADLGRYWEPNVWVAHRPSPRPL